MARQRQSSSPASPPTFPLSSHHETPTTPPSSSVTPSVQSLEHVPLGRSTHQERVRRLREEGEVDRDIGMLPPSPSPAKVTPLRNGSTNRSGLIPRFNLSVHNTPSNGVSLIELVHSTC